MSAAVSGLSQLLAHGMSSARAEDPSFQKRIAGEAVGSVHACAGSFTGGEETRNIGASFEINLYAAHQVMCRRPDRDEIHSDVEVVLGAGLIDAREALAQMFGIEMAHV